LRRPRAVLGDLARVVITSLFSRQRQFITLKFLNGAEEEATALPGSAPPQTECFMVESMTAFERIAKDIGTSFRDSPEDLRARVAAGCVLCVARRPRRRGPGMEIVGYEIAERGVFSALGRRTPVADDVIFSHYVEVLPECRGQRIHRLLFSTRDAWFRQRGGRVVCGVCEPQNYASLRALRRDGAVVVGTVERVALLRVFVMSYTPFDRIADLLY
jgi:GNAT superfamily N-acetyltransferase